MSAVLDRLLHRAAAITKPYNTRDAVLLINALAALRMNRKEVRTVCEKACFSLASSPEEVDAPVAVDIVNHLAKLQCAHLPVVRKVLLQRFCELSAHQQRQGTRTSPLDPRTAQKAALALIKVGRTASSEAAVEHVLRLLHEMLHHHARDPGLRLAYVALYPYSSRFTQQPSWWSSIPPHKPSVSTLAASLRFLLRDSKAYRRASGNVAWQLLHALLVLPPLSHHDENVCEVPLALVSDFEAYCESGGLAHVTSIGAYAEFLQTFATDAVRHSPQLICTLLRGLFVAEAKNLNSVSAATREQLLLKSTSRLRPMNIYDATKVAGAISQVLPVLAAFTRGDGHPLSMQHSDAVSDADDDDVDFLLSAPEQERDSPADTAQEAVRLAMNALAELVDFLQAGKLKTVRADDDAPPDTLLSASLLHAYAKSTRCRSAAPCVGDALGVLLGLLPKITNAMPSQLSWMLVSLATLSSNSATGSSGRDGAALLSNAALLLRRYVGVGAVKQRSLRTDVEVLYSCSRFAADAARRCTGSRFASLRSHSKTAVSADGEREAKGEDDEKVEELSGESATLTASPLVFSKEDMVKLMDEVTRRLMVAQAARAPAPHKEDVDMLLVALLDLHSAPSAAEAHRSNRSSGNAAQEKNAFAAALATLQRVLLKCWEGSQEVAAEEGWEGLVLRTVRLHVLATCVANAAFSSDKEAADGLTLLYLSHLQVIEHSTAEVDSSVMLRCLAQLQLYPSAAADTEARPLLRLLCGKYQRYMTQCAHATEVGAETVGQIVRVLRRARQAGVHVVFGCSAASGGDASQAAVQPMLRFPLVLTRPENVSAHTAADLLQLIVDAGLPHTGAGDDLSLRVASELTASLVARLREVPNVSCIVRVLHLTRTQRTASLLFPSSAGVTELLWCVEAHVAYCLKSTGERTEGASEVRRRAQNASRLLAAVLSSQLLLTLTFSTLKEVGNLQTDLLRLADYVETGGRRADEAAVLKARLLCGGIV